MANADYVHPTLPSVRDAQPSGRESGLGVISAISPAFHFSGPYPEILTVPIRTVMAIRRLLLIYLSFASILLSQSGPAAPQPDVETLRTEVARLRQTIQAQQTELESLEQKLNSYVPPVPIAPSQGSLALPVGGPLGAPQSPFPVRDLAPDPMVDARTAVPIELNGYFSSRFTRLSSPGAVPDTEQQTVSLLIDKTVENWQFHTELEFEYGPDFTTFRTPQGPDSTDIGIENAWVDYTYKDLFHVKAGIVLTPTYWALHHYPSIALSVQNPLIHEQIFPKSIVAAMAHGSHYFEKGGFDYSVYAGAGFDFRDPQVQQDGRGAMGGTFLAHVPTGRIFDVFDAGVQYYRDKPAPGDRQQIYGFENRIEKGPFEFLGEMAHASIGPQNGTRRLFRQGYYLEPAWRLRKRYHAYYRYDWLKLDSRDITRPFTDEHTLGLNFRPVPTLSLKLEWNSARPVGSFGPFAQGFGTGIAFFFQ